MAERVRVLLALATSNADLTKSLSAPNFELVEANDGIDALVKALASRFDIIIADADLPGIDGARLCQVLRQDPLTRDIPFVLAAKDRPTSSALLAVDLVIDSPVEAPALLMSIRQAIDVKNLESMPHGVGFPASHRHRRGQTINPPLAPPHLICPRCDRPLMYLYSHLGGINERSAEQWDYFDCTNKCGTFQYRQRTRRLRPAPGLPRYSHSDVGRP